MDFEVVKGEFIDSEEIKNKIIETINELIFKYFFSRLEIEQFFCNDAFCHKMFGIPKSLLCPAFLSKPDYLNYHIFLNWTKEQWQNFTKWRKYNETKKLEIETTIKKMVAENYLSETEIHELLSRNDFCYEMFESTYPILVMPLGEPDYFHILSNWTKEQYQRFNEWPKRYKTISRSIKVGEFKNSNLISVIIQSPADAIGSRAFEGCRYLSYVKISSSVTYIGANAFSNCPNLQLCFDSPSYWMVSHSVKETDCFKRIFISEKIPHEYLHCYLFQIKNKLIDKQIQTGLDLLEKKEIEKEENRLLDSKRKEFLRKLCENNIQELSSELSKEIKNLKFTKDDIKILENLIDFDLYKKFHKIPINNFVKRIITILEYLRKYEDAKENYKNNNTKENMDVISKVLEELEEERKRLFSVQIIKI